ncbi:MAG: hypothetical protein RBT11_04885 [Desulfobacterales bacterium]|jgi:hypothetical protein|nr:hypothetical protein [Desulfobacterales bacterium]
MIKKLASVTWTFWSLIFLFGLLSLGVALTFIKPYSKSIRLISEQLPLDWLLKFHGNDGVVLVWFLLTCLIGGVLFINLLCCTGLRLVAVLKNKKMPRQWLFIVLHGMFAVVMLCHGLAMVMGCKHSNIRLWPGEHRAFEGGYAVALSHVEFKDQMDMLKADYQARRSLMTRKSFHPEKNYAFITFTQNEELIVSGAISMLNPLVTNGKRVTLTDFLYDEAKAAPVGISLVIVESPLTAVFFMSYIFLILSLTGFVIYTWKPSQ